MKKIIDFFKIAPVVLPERLKKLKFFCRITGLKFNDYKLLDLAFHHRSYSNEIRPHRHYNNERLEFLGDSVLGTVTASFLYKDMPEKSEGDLSKIKSAVVSEKTLAPIALKFGIDKMLIMGKGAEINKEFESPSILADCMEAIIGAYYLDSGYASVEKYVLSFIIPEVRKIQQNQGVKDYKSLLQELCQKKYRSYPEYKLVSKTGPDHDQTFNVSVSLENVTYGPVSAKSKKQAEQNAAKIAYEKIVADEKIKY
ncbi:ribonuclease III [Treponema parvum]|uniref:Ribonuclease 3 n=1 Tax=Treponema parvum TaxID=138851 RepID=A0A975EZX2_9SPIR|nr:ribonuclease III [Treponema parvum]QTQ11843.1 ribonuclease III [Treponema parvum]